MTLSGTMWLYIPKVLAGKRFTMKTFDSFLLCIVHAFTKPNVLLNHPYESLNFYITLTENQTLH